MKQLNIVLPLILMGLGAGMFSNILPFSIASTEAELMDMFNKIPGAMLVALEPESNTFVYMLGGEKRLFRYNVLTRTEYELAGAEYWSYMDKILGKVTTCTEAQLLSVFSKARQFSIFGGMKTAASSEIDLISSDPATCTIVYGVRDSSGNIVKTYRYNGITHIEELISTTPPPTTTSPITTTPPTTTPPTITASPTTAPIVTSPSVVTTTTAKVERAVTTDWRKLFGGSIFLVGLGWLYLSRK